MKSRSTLRVGGYLVASAFLIGVISQGCSGTMTGPLDCRAAGCEVGFHCRQAQSTLYVCTPASPSVLPVETADIRKLDDAQAALFNFDAGEGRDSLGIQDNFESVGVTLARRESFEATVRSD